MSRRRFGLVLTACLCVQSAPLFTTRVLPFQDAPGIVGLASVFAHEGHPEARIADQERDGVAAEIIYPTVGMVICNHRDFDYKHACFEAYNRWIADYCSHNPKRLIGVGQTAMKSPADGVRDLEQIKKLGLRGVMMPGTERLDEALRQALTARQDAKIVVELTGATLRRHRGRLHVVPTLKLPPRALFVR